MKIQPIIGKWQPVFRYGQDNFRFPERGWREVELGVIRFKFLPGEGEAFGKGHYDGFILRFAFWKPIELK